MSPRVTLAAVVAVALSEAVGGCDAAPDEPRAAWLVATLYEDHAQLLMREPALVEDKLALLAGDTFDFLRGTLPQWVRDTTEPGAVGALATRLAVPAASHMLLIGDPHPENLGTFLVGPRVVVDYEDYDAATWGPWQHDLRRLATMTRAYADTVGVVSAGGDPDAVVRAVVHGYVAGLDPAAPADAPLGRIAGDLAERAAAARDEPEVLALDDARVAVDAEAEALVARLVAAWPASCIGACAAGAVRRIVRRLGAGVASLPLLRWYVELEGASADAGDAVVLELREAPPPPALPQPAALTTWGFAHNAERVVLAQRRLQASGAADPWLGWAAIDRWSVRVKRRTPFMKDLARDRVQERLADGRWTADDVYALAELCGRLLGAAHRRSPLGPDATATAGPVLWAALAGREGLLADETVRFAALMHTRAAADRASLAALLARDGPLLGWDAALAASTGGAW